MNLRAALVALFLDTVARLDPALPVRQMVRARPELPPRVSVVALGKAAHRMSHGAMQALAERGVRRVAGVVVVPAAGASMSRSAIAADLEATLATRVADGPSVDSACLRVIQSSHPVPDQRSMQAARAVLREVSAARPDDLILALISGGGSALVALPAGGLSLADKVVATRQLAARGATIAELNVVRKHLSAVKGGQLAQAAKAPILTLVSSDVIGDELATIASGPTVPDISSFADAAAVLKRYLPTDAVPPAVWAHVQRGIAGRLPDTPAVGRPVDRAHLVAGTGALASTAQRVAAEAGWHVEAVLSDVRGDVAQVAHSLAARARALVARQPRRATCIIATGEPTIALPEVPGRGGRAHHLALLLARDLAGMADMAVLVAGSDGMDGNSSAAGAIVDGRTWQRLHASGVDGERALRECDAAGALARVDASIATGATGVNHADIMVLSTAGADMGDGDTSA